MISEELIADLRAQVGAPLSWLAAAKIQELERQLKDCSCAAGVDPCCCPCLAAWKDACTLAEADAKMLREERESLRKTVAIWQNKYVNETDRAAAVCEQQLLIGHAADRSDISVEDYNAGVNACISALSAIPH